ncbi:terminase [Bacteroidales bacterium]|nr:terminase [Bacteroidales bacterium]
MVGVMELLRENRRRMEESTAPYDPISGHDEPGRYYFPVKGLECWLPLEMRREELVIELSRLGSLDEYFAEMGGAGSDEMRERVMEQWTRLRCRHDFPFWAATFAYIKRKGGGDDVPFILNRPQRRLVGVLEGMRRAQRPIRLILLKARQWGGSTCVQLYMAWLQLVHEKGLNSLIVAHQGTATDEIMDMFDRMLSHYPAKYLHEQDEDYSDDEKKLVRAGGFGSAFRVVARNCKVKVGTAERPNSCRGGDYNLVHCSEVGLWPSTKRKTPEDLARAATAGVLLRPMTMIVYESTANGTGNFFHTEWNAAKSGESQFAPMFVAWYEIEQNSLPFSSPEEEERFAADLIAGREAEQPLSSRRQPGQYLWWLWEKGATLEAIHWYVSERAKYSDHGQMASECPSDDVEAFVHSGARVFDKYKVEALRAGCCAPAMRGEIDGDKPSGEGSLKNVRFNADPHGALAMWRDREITTMERVTDRYLVVVDIGGRSLTADWSVIVVFDRAPMAHGEGPEVVAQWRGHTDFDLLAWNAARIAKYYDNALLVIESNTLETHDPDRSGGSEQSSFILNRLRDAYDNLYARKRNEDEIRQGAPVRYGFHTNVNTKPMVISMLVQAIREGQYVERDEGCLAEYMVYEQRQNGSYGALPGHHDDMLMTRAIGLHICYQEMPTPRIVMRTSGGNPYRPRPVSAAVF